MVEITQQQKDDILDLQAKLKLYGNKLLLLQTAKTDALNTEEDKYKTALQAVCAIHDSKIATIQLEITTIEASLAGVK